VRHWANEQVAQLVASDSAQVGLIVSSQSCTDVLGHGHQPLGCVVFVCNGAASGDALGLRPDTSWGILSCVEEQERTPRVRYVCAAVLMIV
jgi:hypothetical protein